MSREGILVELCYPGAKDGLVIEVPRHVAVTGLRLAEAVCQPHPSVLSLAELPVVEFRQIELVPRSGFDPGDAPLVLVPKESSP